MVGDNLATLVTDISGKGYPYYTILAHNAYIRLPDSISCLNAEVHLDERWDHGESVELAIRYT